MMKYKRRLICCALVILVSAFSLGAQDRFALVAPNDIPFARIRGYEDWKVVAPSFRTDNNEVRVILANDVMIDAFREEAPRTGEAFPEGSVIVKTASWAERSPSFPAALVPGVLKRVEFIVKDSRRFPATSGWGYARFVYDAKKDLFAPYGKDAGFAQECYSCHTIVKDHDYIFTQYPLR
jgi:hypothetical protein